MGFWEAFLNWLRRYGDALPLVCFVGLICCALRGRGAGDGEGRRVGDLKVLLVLSSRFVKIVTDAVKLQLACGKLLACSNVIITA